LVVSDLQPADVRESIMDMQLVETRNGDERANAGASQSTGDLDDAVDMFVHARPRLLKIAYRILGDVSEAEDVVQEAWLRWQATDRSVVVSPPALLATTTTRLAINVSQSARRRRESCASPWLPEPADTGVDPVVAAEQLEAVERVVLLLMEILTPTERAAYILREGLGYPYRRISAVLQLGVPNSRQLVRRAQLRLAAARRRQPVNWAAHRRLVDAFVAATQTGDLIGLEELLAAGVSQPIREARATA
jgi:RNA polymerase sigma factor (sigma-70 family)